MTDLNHPKVQPLSPEIAAGFGFDPTFVDFVFAESRPGCFDYWVESTEHSWTCHVPEHVEVAHPLWSTNADETLVCLGQGRRWFMRGGHHACAEVNHAQDERDSKAPMGSRASWTTGGS